MSEHQNQKHPSYAELPAIPREPHVYDEVLGKAAVMNADTLAYHTVVQGQLEVNNDTLIRLRAKNTPLTKAEEQVIDRVQAEQEDPAHHFHDIEIDEAGKDLSDSLNEVRYRLLTLDQAHVERLDAYLDTTISPFFKQLKDEQAPKTPWAHWLGVPKEEESANGFGVTDEQLTNFLQWHVSTLEERQTQPEHKRETEKLKLEFGIFMDEAAGIWLSEKVKHDKPRLDSLTVYEGDLFDAASQVHGRDADQEYIVLDTTANPDQRRNAFFHLATKKLLREPVMSAEYKQRPVLFADPWFVNALTEHTRLALQTGDATTVQPDLRKEIDAGMDAVAIFERRLLDALLIGGEQEIDPAEATRAFTGTAKEREKFLDSLRSAWEDPEIDLKISLAMNLTALLAQNNQRQHKQTAEESGVPESELTDWDVAAWQLTKRLYAGKEALNRHIDDMGFDPDTMGEGFEE